MIDRRATIGAQTLCSKIAGYKFTAINYNTLLLWIASKLCRPCNLPKYSFYSHMLNEINMHHLFKYLLYCLVSNSYFPLCTWLNDCGISQQMVSEWQSRKKCSLSMVFLIEKLYNIIRNYCCSTSFYFGEWWSASCSFEIIEFTALTFSTQSVSKPWNF